MNVALTGGPLSAPILATLHETSRTSLQYSSVERVSSDVRVDTPATDGQGIFYIEMAGTIPTKITLSSGSANKMVFAVPVKGHPNLLRTGKLVLIAHGDPFRSPDITTFEMPPRGQDSALELKMYGRTTVH
jgi:hypothetical protein